MKTNVIGYARISSTKGKKGNATSQGENNSIEVQIKKITEYCKFKNLNLIEIIQDKDISGGKEFATRKGGIRAQEHFDNGVCTIVTTKIDRLFRNVLDGIGTTNLWNKKGIDLHIMDMDGASFTTKTAIGKLMFTTIVSFSEYERAVTGERTAAILSDKKSTGKAYCGSLLGFDNVDGQMVENKKEMNIINDIFRAKGRGMSAAKIANELNFTKTKAKKGGIFHPSTIQAILKNKIYNQHSLAIQ
jgi:DNA invertase Pin-like site-specific DNA recombinase